MGQPVMRLRAWGVRGSIPTPISEAEIKTKLVAALTEAAASGLFAGGRPPNRDEIERFVNGLPRHVGGTFGGETTCFEIQVADSPLIIIDCGSGGRRLSHRLLEAVMQDQPLNPLCPHPDQLRVLHLFFTHYHWDHIQGFPFFAPAYVPGKRRISIHLYGKKNPLRSLEETLTGQQLYPNFPVAFQDMPCSTTIHELSRLDPAPVMLGRASVRYQELTHPDAVFAYSIEADGRKVVIATDTEHKSTPDPRLLSLARNADLLYYDSHYLPEEYVGTPGALTGAMHKLDWGHSTYEWAIRTALAAGVKRVLLGHHEPLRDDAVIHDLELRAQRFAAELLAQPEHRGQQLAVEAAAEGAVFEF